MAVTITNDAATTRTNLGLGDAATKTVGTGASNIPLNSNLGDAATKTVGTSAGNIPILDSSGKLPAISGENLTGIVALPTGGSVGQVVTNTAAGAGNWQDAAAGGLELINEYAFSSSNSTLEVTLKAPVDSNYLCDVLYFSNLLPSSNGDLIAKFLDSGGSAVTTQMTSGFEFKDMNASGNNYYYNTDGRLCNNLSATDSNHGASGQIWIYTNSAQNTARCPYLIYEFTFIASGGQKRHVEGSAMINAALSTVRKLKLQTANGNGFQQNHTQMSNSSVLHYALRRT